MFFYWQSNGRVEGFTMCILSDAYAKLGGFLLLNFNLSDFYFSVSILIQPLFYKELSII